MSRERRTLLVIDSSASHRFYLGTLLRRLEYTVMGAKSAEDAVKLMAEGPPSLVITDYALPEMNGIDLLSLMKQYQRLRTIPVIMQSAEDSTGMKERCAAAGCMAYFKKPADIESLYKVIQYALESSPRKTIRIEIAFRVEIGDGTVPGGTVRQEYATVLSEGGLYIRTLTPEHVNAVVPLALFIDDRVIKATAVVLNVSKTIQGNNQGPGMGMKFITIDEKDRAFVRDYIKKTISQGLSV